MKLYRALDELPADFAAGALTIGNFDGVHRGHATLIKRLIQRAADNNGCSVVFTFAPHPVRLLRPENAPAPLTWVRRKAELLEKLGVDAVVAYPTNRELLAHSPQQYFQHIVLDQLRAKAIVEGPNFFFGKDRAGDTTMLQALCDQAGVSLDIVEPLVSDQQFISSSRIRQAISDGRLGEANEMLTQPYRIRGLVTHGAGRGATIGFPTANISGIDTLLPAWGVYAGAVTLDDQVWPAAINVGSNPTFGEQATKVEVHLIGYRGSLYGSVLEVDFWQRLRDVQTFGSAEELKAQLQLDLQATVALHQ